jgi:hypothetical protein
VFTREQRQVFWSSWAVRKGAPLKQLASRQLRYEVARIQAAPDLTQLGQRLYQCSKRSRGAIRQRSGRPMFACAKQQIQAEVQLGRPCRFEMGLMAVLSAHAKRIEQVRMRLEAISTETHRSEGNPPDV